MRAGAPHKWTKVHPNRLTPRDFSTKKLEIPLAPMVNRESLERSRVTVTPPHLACSESLRRRRRKPFPVSRNYSRSRRLRSVVIRHRLTSTGTLSIHTRDILCKCAKVAINAFKVMYRPCTRLDVDATVYTEVYWPRRRRVRATRPCTGVGELRKRTAVRTTPETR